MSTNDSTDLFLKLLSLVRFIYFFCSLLLKINPSDNAQEYRSDIYLFPLFFQ